MKALHRTLRSKTLPLIGVFMVALFLTGCYTQLETADRERTSQQRPAQSASDYAPRTNENLTTRELLDWADQLERDYRNGRIDEDTYWANVAAIKETAPGFYGAYYGDSFYYTPRYAYVANQRARFERSSIGYSHNYYGRPAWARGAFHDPFFYDPFVDPFYYSAFGSSSIYFSFGYGRFFHRPYYRRAFHRPYFYSGGFTYYGGLNNRYYGSSYYTSTRPLRTTRRSYTPRTASGRGVSSRSARTTTRSASPRTERSNANTSTRTGRAATPRGRGSTTTRSSGRAETNRNTGRTSRDSGRTSRDSSGRTSRDRGKKPRTGRSSGRSSERTERGTERRSERSSDRSRTERGNRSSRSSGKSDTAQRERSSDDEETARALRRVQRISSRPILTPLERREGNAGRAQRRSGSGDAASEEMSAIQEIRMRREAEARSRVVVPSDRLRQPPQRSLYERERAQRRYTAPRTRSSRSTRTRSSRSTRTRRSSPNTRSSRSSKTRSSRSSGARSKGNSRSSRSSGRTSNDRSSGRSSSRSSNRDND